MQEKYPVLRPIHFHPDVLQLLRTEAFDQRADFSHLVGKYIQAGLDACQPSQKPPPMRKLTLGEGAGHFLRSVKIEADVDDFLREKARAFNVATGDLFRGYLDLGIQNCGKSSSEYQ